MTSEIRFIHNLDRVAMKGETRFITFDRVVMKGETRFITFDIYPLLVHWKENSKDIKPYLPKENSKDLHKEKSKDLWVLKWRSTPPCTA